MKIQSSNTKHIYNYEPNGERSLCPECSHLRKKKADKCLAWDKNNNRGYCHNCNAAFFEYRPHEPKEFIVPEWKNITKLSDKAVKYFEGRMISQETLFKMRIYSDEIFMPQFNKEVEVICFPYFYNSKLINIKYRGPSKSFKLVSGAELIFYNIDCIQKSNEIIITEGEIDALSFIESGFNNAISVPNGANKNLEYLDSCIEIFNGIEKVYIATDQDTKGIELKTELIRRFGPERCYVVSFKDCKDANEYLLKYGPDFKDLINDSKPVPVKGVIEMNSLYADIRNLYENGIQKGKEIGHTAIDECITWETGRLAIVTGIPSCFTKEQLIHTSEGVKKISDIKEGDLVLSYSHERKIEQYKYVLNVNKFDVHTDKLYKIKLKDGTIIKVTGSHKFFTGVEYLQIEKILLSLGKDK